MAFLPVLKPSEVIKVLVNKAGFMVDHVSGSYYALWHPQTGRRVTVPYHNRELKSGTLHSIIKQAGLSREEFIRLV